MKRTARIYEREWVNRKGDLCQLMADTGVPGVTIVGLGVTVRTLVLTFRFLAVAVGVWSITFAFFTVTSGGLGVGIGTFSVAIRGLSVAIGTFGIADGAVGFAS